MAQIDSAYFGDDTATRNITDSLRRKVTARKLDVTANSELIPAFEAAPETKLEVEDEKKIREEAVRTCGEANQQCIESTKTRLRQEKMQEKERVNMSSANTVKGRRLTVNLVDKDGKRRTVIVPDGQKLTLDDVDGGETTMMGGVKMPSMEFITGQFGNLATWFMVGLIQAFGLAAFVMMLRDEAPVFWQQYVLEGGWGSVIAGVFAGLFLLVIPFGPLGLVVLFYIGKGLYNEFKK
jgi:hypothetical protein